MSPFSSLSNRTITVLSIRKYFALCCHNLLGGPITFLLLHLSHLLPCKKLILHFPYRLPDHHLFTSIAIATITLTLLLHSLQKLIRLNSITTLTVLDSCGHTCLRATSATFMLRLMKIKLIWWLQTRNPFMMSLFQWQLMLLLHGLRLIDFTSVGIAEKILN